jgi:hypothetical protein
VVSGIAAVAVVTQAVVARVKFVLFTNKEFSIKKSFTSYKVKNSLVVDRKKI